MKILFNLLIGILILFLLISCQKSEDAANKKPTVAFVMKTLNNPYFIEMQKGAVEAANRLGINLVVQAADREVDVEKQMQIIENLIQRNVSVICITPSGSREIVPAIKKANEANIPVIIVDTRVDKKTLEESKAVIVSFIGSDNVDGGRIAGKFIIDKLNGEGNIAILEGIPGHETGDARLKGLYDALKNSKGIKIAASQTANWERDQGYSVFQNILQSHPEIDAVFACNDMMALGAVEAIAASKIKKKIIVIGFDVIKDSRESILKEDMSASVAQHPEEMGKLSVENAFRIIKGEKIEKEIPVKIELITKDMIQK